MAYGKSKNNYIYEKIIQTNHGYGWDDEISVDTDSKYNIINQKDRKEFITNLKLYRENTRGGVRVIKRKTKR